MNGGQAVRNSRRCPVIPIYAELRHSLEGLYSHLSTMIQMEFNACSAVTSFVLDEVMPPIQALNSRLQISTDTIRSSFLIPTVSLQELSTKTLDDAVLMQSYVGAENANKLRTISELRRMLESELCYGLEDKLDDEFCV